MSLFYNFFSNRNITAWLLLTTALALHVLDEALSDFLAFYNPSVMKLKEQLGFFPAPTFSFSIWLVGLIILIVVLYFITFFIAHGGRIIQIFTLVFAILMLLNGMGHLVGSIYFGEILPGMWSSPLLIAAALFVAYQGFKGTW